MDTCSTSFLFSVPHTRRHYFQFSAGFLSSYTPITSSASNLGNPVRSALCWTDTIKFNLFFIILSTNSCFSLLLDWWLHLAHQFSQIPWISKTPSLVRRTVNNLWASSTAILPDLFVNLYCRNAPIPSFALTCPSYTSVSDWIGIQAPTHAWRGRFSSGHCHYRSGVFVRSNDRPFRICLPLIRMVESMTSVGVLMTMIIPSWL